MIELNESPARRPAGTRTMPRQTSTSRRRRASSRALLSAALAASLAMACAQPAAAHPHVWVSVETTLIVEQGSVVGVRHRWTFDELYTAMAIHGLDTNKDGIYSREELAELAQVNIDGLKQVGFFTFARLGAKALAVSSPKDWWMEYAPPPATSKPVQSPAAAVAAVAAATAEPPPPEPQPGLLSRLWNGIFGPSQPDQAAAPTAPAAPAKASEPARVLALEFTVSLAQPVLVDAPDFGISVHDPDWFIAFELAEGDPVRLSGAPEGCRIDLGEGAKASDDDVRRIGDAFSGQLGGGGPAAARLSGTKLIKINCGSKS